jgi:hypothetical protein
VPLTAPTGETAKNKLWLWAYCPADPPCRSATDCPVFVGKTIAAGENLRSFDNRWLYGSIKDGIALCATCSHPVLTWEPSVENLPLP